MNTQFIYLNSDLTVGTYHTKLEFKTNKPKLYQYVPWNYYYSFQKHGDVFNYICDINNLMSIYKCLNNKEIELLEMFIFNNFI